MGSTLSSCPSVVGDIAAMVGLSSGEGSHHPSSVEFVGGAKYSVTRLLAEGGYAYVYLAVDTTTRRVVALKRFTLDDGEKQTKAREEVNIHRSLCPHPAIVDFFDSSVLHRGNMAMPELWIAMEYCSGPSAQEYVNSLLSSTEANLSLSKGTATVSPTPPRRILPPSEVFGIVNSLVLGIAHMHAQSPPIAHWDIKLDNILRATTTMGSPAWKLCDFGSASQVYYEVRNAHDVSVAEVELNSYMTLLYRSPESLDLWSKQIVDTKADVWSLGVAIYVLVFLEMPFDESPMDVLGGVPKLYRNHDSGVPRLPPANVNKEAGSPSDDAHQATSEAFGGPTAAAEMPGLPAAEVVPHTPVGPVPVEYAALMDVVMSGMLVKNPEQRQDIFTIAERLAPVTKLPAVAHPRKGFQSKQQPRFS